MRASFTFLPRVIHFLLLSTRIKLHFIVERRSLIYDSHCCAALNNCTVSDNVSREVKVSFILFAFDTRHSSTIGVPVVI